MRERAIWVMVAVAGLLWSAIATAASAAALADVDAEVRAALRATGTPGASAALVRGCKVVESRAWGVRNRLTGGVLRPTDSMQAASLGKPVAALGVVRLARSGQLGFGLDAPLGDAAVRAGVTPVSEAGAITLGELLSHSAGLPANRRKLLPHSRGKFHYSTAGFGVVQAVATNALGQPYTRVVQSTVLQPIGMSSSSYLATADVPPHVALAMILKFLAPAWAGVTLILVLAALAVRRAVRKEWRLGPRAALSAVGIGVAVACALMSLALGATVVPTLAAVAAVMICAAGAGAWLAGRLGGRARAWRIAAGTLIAPLLVAGLGRDQTIPFPTRLGGSKGDIAFSLVTTPTDLARFAAVLMQPSEPFRADVAAMLEPRVVARADIQWAAGIGRVRTPDRGVVLWQWGSNPGVKSLFLAAPERCEALVVLTNGTRGDEVAALLSRSVLRLDPAQPF